MFSPKIELGIVWQYCTDYPTYRIKLWKHIWIHTEVKIQITYSLVWNVINKTLKIRLLHSEYFPIMNLKMLIILKWKYSASSLYDKFKFIFKMFIELRRFHTAEISIKIYLYFINCSSNRKQILKNIFAFDMKFFWNLNLKFWV